jgi:predicted PurR-regulated permease PerM
MKMKRYLIIIVAVGLLVFLIAHYFDLVKQSGQKIVKAIPQKTVAGISDHKNKTSENFQKQVNQILADFDRFLETQTNYVLDQIFK